MAVVVTGSAGFIGRAVVAELMRRGVPVVGVDRRETPAPAGHLVLTGDLLDRDELVDAAFETADAVLHLAGCPGVRDDTRGRRSATGPRQRRRHRRVSWLPSPRTCRWSWRRRPPSTAAPPGRPPRRATRCRRGAAMPGARSPSSSCALVAPRPAGT